MSTFALIHGAGVGGGWFWHLVEAELRSLGHTTAAPTLWTGDETATLHDYADAVVNTIDVQDELFVVAHSFGGFTAPLVAERLPTSGLIYVTAMVPGLASRRPTGGATPDIRRPSESRPPKTVASPVPPTRT